MKTTKSKTYKFRAPGISEHAIYFTIVGEKIPEMMFINSKEMESFQWISALMVSYSKRFSDLESVLQVVKEMKETFDPKGSYTIPGSKGEKANSVVHHLGLILESHCCGIQL